MADEYIELKGKGSPETFDPKDWQDTVKYYANKKVLFLLRLLDKRQYLTVEIIERIDKDLMITDEKNPEIGQRWFPLAIMNGYFPAFPKA